VAYDGEGYASFVRIGLDSSDLDSLQITPIDDTGEHLVGVIIEADEIANLKQDAGRGYEPDNWYLGDLDCGAAICYLDADTGKLVSVLTLQDSAYPSAAAARSGVAHSAGGDGLVAEGVFSAVFDAQGHNLAPGGATRVALDGGGPSVLQ